MNILLLHEIQKLFPNFRIIMSNESLCVFDDMSEIIIKIYHSYLNLRKNF